MKLNMMNGIYGMINLPFQGEKPALNDMTQGVAIGLK